MRSEIGAGITGSTFLGRIFASASRKASGSRCSLTTCVHTNNQICRNYLGYATRHYQEAGFTDHKVVKRCGDHFKIVVKPELVSFPRRGMDLVIKSAAMLSSGAFV